MQTMTKDYTFKIYNWTNLNNQTAEMSKSAEHTFSADHCFGTWQKDRKFIKIEVKGRIECHRGTVHQYELYGYN